MERASNLKSRYNDRPLNQVVLSDAIQQQERDYNRGLSRNHVTGPVSMASRNHA